MKFRCHRCNEIFESDTTLHEHQNRTVPCTRHEYPRNYEDGFDEDQREQLRIRRQGITEEDKWKLTYQILFPGEETIPSPCRLSSSCCSGLADIHFSQIYSRHHLQSKTSTVRTVRRIPIVFLRIS